jgi:hypothetical protein
MVEGYKAELLCPKKSKSLSLQLNELSKLFTIRTKGSKSHYCPVVYVFTPLNSL